MSSPHAPRHVLAFHYRSFANPKLSGEYKKWFNPPVNGVASERCAYHPWLGFYDSLDPTVIEQHAVWARQAGLTGLIFGYWMRDGWEGHDLGAKMLDVLHGHGLKLTVYLEKQPAGVDGAVADFRWLDQRGLRHPAWLRVNGRPVFLLYAGAFRQLPAAQWRQAAKAYATADGRPEPLLIGDVDPDKPDYADIARWLDGTHQYTLSNRLTGKTPAEIDDFAAEHYPAWRRASGDKIFCATVEPGWNDLKVTDRKPPRPTVDRFGTETFEGLWNAALRQNADWVIVGTFNDWSNGTQMEPSREWGQSTLGINATYAKRFLAREV